MGQSRLGYIIPIIIFIIFKTCNSYIKLSVLKNLSQVVDSTKEFSRKNSAGFSMGNNYK